MKKWLGALAVGLLAVVGSAHAAETVTYYYTSPQGTVLATTDANGNLLSSADYRPYGQQVLGQPEAGPGYTGHVNDTDSGLIYMQARYYDASLGRFLSTDKKEREAGSLFVFGRYSYANGNPILNIDPDGLDSRVSLYAYSLNVPFNPDISHSFVRIDDLDRGQSFVARAGPSEPVGNFSGLSNVEQARKDAGLLEMSPKSVFVLATPPQDASTAHDSNHPGARAIAGTAVVVPGDTRQLLDRVANLNRNLNAAEIPYKAQTQNSNSYAVSLYSLITDKPAPVSQSLPGSDKNISNVMTNCEATAGCKQ
jgi:RHS repeat-associated protein